MVDPQYPDDQERSDGTVEPDANDNSAQFGVPSTSTEMVDGPPGGPEMAEHE